MQAASVVVVLKVEGGSPFALLSHCITYISVLYLHYVIYLIFKKK